MENKSKAQKPGTQLPQNSFTGWESQSLLEKIYDKSQVEKLTIPYSTANLERINHILDYHSGYFQNIIFFNHNNFEINVFLEKFAPTGGSRTQIENLSGAEIDTLFIQFIAFFETSKSRGFDFIDFESYRVDNEGCLRFPILLSKNVEPDLRQILAIFQKRKEFAELNETNYKEIFSNLSAAQTFNENRVFLYRFSDFTTNIVNTYPGDRPGHNANFKINIKTANKIQEKIIKINLANSNISDDILLINVNGGARNLPAAITEYLQGKPGTGSGDFAAAINEIKLFFRKSSYNYLLLLIDNLKTKENSEFIKYLLDSSGLTDILLIVFGENKFIDFDLELKERPRNLLEKYFRFYHTGKMEDLSRDEIFLLKVFKTIPGPLSNESLKKVFSPDECRVVKGLIDKKCLKIVSGNISLNANAPGYDITVSQKEEKDILKLFLDKFDSINLSIKYLINTGREGEIKKILKKYLQNRFKFEDGSVDTGKLFFEHLNFLHKEVELIRLFAEIFIKENDLFSARELIRSCRENDPVFLDLKLARIYALEKNYGKMEHILKRIERKIPADLEDEFYYLKFINCVKKLDYDKAEKYYKKIKSEWAVHLADIILSDRYIYRGELHKAELLLEKTISYLNKIRYFRDECDAKNQLAKVLREKKEYDKADILYKNIFITSEINNYKLLSGHIAVDIGNLHLVRDEMNRAEAWYKKAMQIYRQQENKNGEILARSNLVEISKIKGNWQEAEDNLRAILHYDKEENKLDSLAVDYFNISHLEYLRHNYTRSLEMLDNAASIFEKKENVKGKIESDFLRVKVAWLKEKKKSGSDVLEKYTTVLDDDQKSVLALLQLAEQKGRDNDISLLIAKINEIKAESLRFEILTVIIKRIKNRELLALLRGLSMELSKETRNYYYYEYYYIYFTFFFSGREADRGKKEIFVDVYYFFLKNKRKISPTFNKLKNIIDEEDASYDLFKSAELVNDYNQWKIPEDMFRSLLNEITKIIKPDLLKLVIYEKDNLLSTFSNPNKYNKLTDEILSAAISRAENLDLNLEETRALVKSDEKFFYFFKNSKVLLWKISENLFAVVLLAFAKEDYKHYNLFEKNRGFFKKFAALIRRYYEVDYKLNSKLHFIIGESLAVERLKQNILAIGKVDFPVLISGESGSGKELIAKGVHIVSRRAGKPFIPVNSAAIPENLLEAELFGYRKGAFTGANEDRTGLIEAAQQGTLFLDEIADLPVSLQAKLLRALQEKEIRRLGENTTRQVNFRLISATNKDLKAMARENRFREDLYYRLEVLNIQVPPLRDHSEDIPLLTEHFLKEYNFPIKDELEFRSIVEYLKNRDWPGNVRELESTIKRFITYYPDFEIGNTVTYKSDFSLKAAKENLEKSLVIKTLRQNNWNKIKSARALGISRVYLFNLIKKYNITMSYPHIP